MQKEAILKKLDYRSFYKNHLPSLKDNGKVEAQALCPFHDDHSPSLSVNLETGLFHCFGCGARGDVITFYERYKDVDFKTALTDLASMVETNSDNGPSRVVARFKYQDVDGKTLYIKERVEPGNNGRSKEFRFKHQKDDKWVMGRGYEPVPYNSPALNKGKYAIIVEGERKVEALREWGLVATCLDSGSQSPWREEYFSYFQGKEKVVILPDNDTPGRKYVQKIAQALQGKVGEVKIIELPGLEESQDIIDWQRKGGTKDQLIDLIRQSPPWSPPKGDDGQERTREEPLKLITAQDILDLEDDLSWLVEALIPQGGVVMVSGRPGVGKTWLALVLSKALSEGLPFLGRHTQGGKVAYVDLENPRTVLKDRLARIRPMAVEFAPAWAMERPFDLWDKDLDTLAKQGYLIILDSLVRAHSFDENSAQEMARVMNRLRDLTHKGATIVLLHHRGKGEDNQYRGSSDILAGVDVAYLLDSKDGHLELKTLKSRVGEELRIPLSLRINPDGVELRDLTQELETQRQAKEKEDMKAIAGVIEKLSREGHTPNQTDIVLACKEELEMGKNTTLELLKKGKGRLWEEGDDPSDRRKKVYSPIKNSFLLSSPYIGSGKEVRLLEAKT